MIVFKGKELLIAIALGMFKNFNYHNYKLIYECFSLYDHYSRNVQSLGLLRFHPKDFMNIFLPSFYEEWTARETAQ